jgi:hypothetical protein
MAQPPEGARCALLLCTRERLAREPRRVAWYPGSEAKVADFRAAIPGVEELGTAVNGAEDGHAAATQPLKAPPAAYSPWLFAAGLSPEQVRCCVSPLAAMHATSGDPGCHACYFWGCGDNVLKLQ